MPIKLVDSNFLQKPALGKYLRDSRSNHIAIAEEVLTEMHKREPQLTVVRCLKQARAYSAQVFVLKGVTSIYGMPIHSAADARKLIDRRQTANFAAWYDEVCASENEPELSAQLEAMQQQAQEQIREVAASVANLEPIFKGMKSQFTPEERQQLRQRVAYGQSTQRKLLDLFYSVSRALFQTSDVPEYRYPKLNYLAHRYFIFRYAMCMTLLYTRWVHWGNLPRDENALVNHVIDMHLAALGTFFQGVATDDALLTDVHREARYLLRVGRRAYVG